MRAKSAALADFGYRATNFSTRKSTQRPDAESASVSRRETAYPTLFNLTKAVLGRFESEGFPNDWRCGNLCALILLFLGQRCRSAAPKPRGGSISPLEEVTAEILAAVSHRVSA
jgi:hypothetical protein